MHFYVIAVPPAEFDDWLREQQQPVAVPADSAAREGMRLFNEYGCAKCHTIDGTEAAGKLGPNLTHFASRLTIGAGAVVNNRGNLAGWVANPHGIKPGSLMPAASLTGEELQSLLFYLETLK
jgi:cytochrome c oxidase subunit 2